MSGQINSLVPLIRKHFDFLMVDWGFRCVRTWNDYMNRYQGVEYATPRVVIRVEQVDSPTLQVRFRIPGSDETSSLTLEAIVREIDPEAWSCRPRGDAWPRPVEQDEEQLRFLAECTRRFGGAWLAA